MAYLTPTELRAYLKISSSSEDDLLEELILSAVAFIEGPEGAGRVFDAPNDTTRVFDGPFDYDDGSMFGTRWPGQLLGPGWVLWLEGQDLCQITSITNGDGTTVDSSAYTVLPLNQTPYYALRLKLDSSVIWTWDNTPEAAISITGRWAYSITPPADIKQACRRLAGWYYRQRDTANDPDRTQITADGVRILPASTPKDVIDILAKYRTYV